MGSTGRSQRAVQEALEAVGCLRPIRGTSVSLAGAGAAGAWSHSTQCTAAELGEDGV